MSFTIAIVGRPNVGKSTLFNRLAGKRLALVDDQPGLTRDRREAETNFGALGVTLIDTAGLEDGNAGLLARMREQTLAAIDQADVVLFLIDARAGIIGADETLGELVRSSGKPTVLAANKCEGRAAEPGFYEAFALGLGEPLAISAEHGTGVGEVIEAIEAIARAAGDATPSVGEDAQPDEARTQPLRLAIVGRPNVGKSTLVNALLGEERMITGPEAGITRDAIAAELEWDGQPLRLFDTAGLRRKMRVEGKAEELSVGDTLRAIRFAEAVVVLLDVEQPFEKQDLQIVDLIEQEGRALIIAVNKWDLVRDKQKRLEALRETCERLLPQIKGLALVPVSGLTGKGLDKLMRAVLAAYALWNRRIPTRALNKWLQGAVEAHAPPAVSGRRVKLRYMTQANARPPTFILFCSRPKAVPDSYTRYLVNALRQHFDMPGVPIRLHLRSGANPYAKEQEFGAPPVTEVLFYHLERRTLEDVLPSLLQRSLAKGWRAAVQAPSEERIEALDTLLWTFAEESFLAHGTVRDGAPGAQPIYLTTGNDNPNGAQIRFLIDGAELDEASAYVRIVFLFDGRDEESVARARIQYKAAKEQGHAVSYWQQDAEGRWQQKA